MHVDSGYEHWGLHHRKPGLMRERTDTGTRREPRIQVLGVGMVLGSCSRSADPSREFYETAHPQTHLGRRESMGWVFSTATKSLGSAGD